LQLLFALSLIGAKFNAAWTFCSSGAICPQPMLDFLGLIYLLATFSQL